MVARSASASSCKSGAKIFDELADHAVLAQHLGDGQHQIGGSRALCSLPVSFTPTTCGISMDTGCPSMAASASIPPTPQPSTPRPLIMVVCESVPTSVSGIRRALAVRFLHENHARQIFQVHLVNDAGIGRHDRQIAEGGLAPAQESIAFFVANEFEFGIELKRLGRAEFVHLHRVINHQLRRLQGIDQRGIAREPLHGIAHGGQIHHRRHAGKVLQQHAAGGKSNFLVGLGFAVPRGQSPDVIRGHIAAVFGAQQIFQQNAERIGKMFGGNALFVQRLETVNLVFLAAHAKDGAAAKTVHRMIAFLYSLV